MSRLRGDGGAQEAGERQESWEGRVASISECCLPGDITPGKHSEARRSRQEDESSPSAHRWPPVQGQSHPTSLHRLSL